MKRYMFILPLAVFAAGCETPAQTVGAGALIGAAVADEDERLRGAAIGAAAGGIVAVLQETLDNDRCIYRNTATGETFEADCP